MSQFINQNSFSLVQITLVIAALAFFTLSRASWKTWVAATAVIAGMGVVWSFVHENADSRFADAAAVRAQIGNQIPVLLELESPYCIGCAVAKPTVDRLESETTGRLNVIRENVLAAPGSELAAELGVRFTPTFILFDAAGFEIWRSVGSLDPSAIKALLP